MDQILPSYQNIEIDLFNFVLNLISAFILSFILALIYNRFSNSLSNKSLFSNNFILITTTTTLMIFVVKSSLALSLGLVGALSIVRFRAAIKEPEELSYLFLCIAIGVGLGANYRVLTLIAFFAIITFIIIQSFYVKKNISSKEMFCTISWKNKLNLEEIFPIIKKNSSFVLLRDFDISDELSQIGFIVSFENSDDLNLLTNELNKQYPGITIKFLNKSFLT